MNEREISRVEDTADAFPETHTHKYTLLRRDTD